MPEWSKPQATKRKMGSSMAKILEMVSRAERDCQTAWQTTCTQCQRSSSGSESRDERNCTRFRGQRCCPR